MNNFSLTVSIALLLFSSCLGNAQLDGEFDGGFVGIVGGENRQQFVPFIVSMLYNDTDRNEVGLMGGGIAINEHYVLTAGHLFDDFPEE